MKKSHAKNLLAKEVEPYRKKSYAELVEMMSAEPVLYDISGPNGRKYHVEIHALWDNQPGGNIRVMSHIDTGGWRALFPITNDFIKNPSGAFVDK